ncbi:J-type co-chaperone jac1, mitochondrial [Schizosaccharomyces pombe]|uniref:J-type co-chaperone jac1, mitochondrial n=1 Tax=Schizosaccharomyces pombe (strain 972 / ATCC 24843) TaxID=284812 RepID=JAC1_SCHPO|nr:putative DNAJ domain-containing protein Jac1 [Schizosaccharomyces pombe]Q9UTL6.1 RecName: Full=J-type co-chaperone jac1, mitochondrial; AltName: Full=J-type accessory chaperone 1; Flags: Precursor [Schizosaccharomyces pombe 972h-]CAB59688.1 mitochondrial DNAJ domain protein Jac1 (predicted) [Schizosaccharomyces pombe]|eukprot:NP_001342917.1 putative DNAJ domain-containing protein Jac1 [Schizosaccharomyces pombe]
MLKQAGNQSFRPFISFAQKSLFNRQITGNHWIFARFKFYPLNKIVNYNHFHSSSCQSEAKNFYKQFEGDISDPPPKGPFDIDLGALKSSYLRKMKTLHPDVAQGKDAALAQRDSAELSKAYNTLKAPLTRAEYILQLQGINPVSEDISNSDPEFLMEIMDVHENISASRDSPEKLLQLSQENQGRKVQEINEIRKAMESSNWDSALLYVNRLRYWNTIDKILHDL